MHHVQHIADGSQNIIDRNSTLTILQGRRADHLQGFALIVALYIDDNSIALAKDGTLLLNSNILQHISIQQHISRHDNLAGFLVSQRLCQNLSLNTALPAQLLGELVAAYSCQVITLGIKEQAAEHLMCIVHVKRLTWTDTAINLLQCLCTSFSIIALQGSTYSIIIVKQCQNFIAAAKYQVGQTYPEMVIIAALHGRYAISSQLRLTQLLLLINVVQGTEKYSYRQLSGTVDTDRNNIVGISFQLNPGTTVRNNCGVEQMLTGLVTGNTIICTRRTHQLADNNTLCTINNKGAGSSHQREITHEYLGILENTGSPVQETNLYPQRCCISSIPLLALIQAVFRLTQLIIQQGQAYLALEI